MGLGVLRELCAKDALLSNIISLEYITVILAFGNHYIFLTCFCLYLLFSGGSNCGSNFRGNMGQTMRQTDPFKNHLLSIKPCAKKLFRNNSTKMDTIPKPLGKNNPKQVDMVSKFIVNKTLC